LQRFITEGIPLVCLDPNELKERYPFLGRKNGKNKKVEFMGVSVLVNSAVEEELNFDPKLFQGKQIKKLASNCEWACILYSF